MRHQYLLVFECLFTGKRVTETISAPSPNPKLCAGLFVKAGHYVRSIEYLGIDPVLKQCADHVIARGGIPV